MPKVSFRAGWVRLRLPRTVASNCTVPLLFCVTPPPEIAPSPRLPVIRVFFAMTPAIW